MSVSFTPQQKAAVEARGRVLVSASAGSGKTFVMIERLVALILEGADIRNVLAVTFTNKAAAQMRDRLRSALLKRIPECEGAERERLKQQLKALPLADICTIHSFCSRLVRANFFLAEVDPAFRIISPDDAEGKLLSFRALEETFEQAYEENGEQFRRLLSVYFQKKKDAKLRSVVTALYSTVRGTADYRELLARAGETDEFKGVCDYLAEDFRMRARYLAACAEDLGAYFSGQSKRAVSVCAAVLSAAAGIASQKSLFEMTALAKEPLKIPAMPPMTKAEGEELKNLRTLSKLSAAVKELYKELKKFDKYETEYARYLDGQGIARALGELVLRYDEALARQKKEAGVLDYDDLEHSALAVLQNAEALAAVRGKYQYLFVDEYQDVNPAQEKILSIVGGEEVFLVGDAKQSIYGFRGSRSEYFTQKEKDFAQSLMLTENFRSCRAVLEAVNRVFAYAMTAESCGIPYASALMHGGSRYGEHDGAVRFHTVPEEPHEREVKGVYSVLKESLPRTDEQAEYVADLIEGELGAEWFDADAGLVKEVSYGDIVVLVRKMTSDAENLIAALSARNIPVTTTASVNICDFWEARLVIDWLSYLDNREQDIPRAGAMLSRIGGFTESELAGIRIFAGNTSRQPRTFREACKIYLDTYAAARKKGARDDLGEKLLAFEERTEYFRALMRVKTAAETANALLAAGLEAEIAAKSDGEARLRRVRRLLGEANGSVNDFLRRLKAADYQVDYAESGGEDAVKVLTMHASKGLEYPVVILASLDASFEGPDRDEVAYTEAFGFAPKSYDTQSRIVFETVLRRASKLYKEREELKGELNLLYVAMTRAKYRLHLVFRGKDGALSPLFAKRFSDFIDFSACGEYFTPLPEHSRAIVERNALVYRKDDETERVFKAAFARPYPYAESLRFEVKSSATALMKQEAEEEHAARGGGGTTVEDGLAYHAFLEAVRFGRPVGEELNRMREEGILSEEQLALLDPAHLEQVLALPSLRALAGKRLWREQKFLVLVPANEIEVYKTSAEDEIVFQGAIDLLCMDENGYLIIDYKFSGRDAETLKAKYAPQLALYKKAVSKALGVDERTVRARIVNIKGLYEVDMT